MRSLLFILAMLCTVPVGAGENPVRCEKPPYIDGCVQQAKDDRTFYYDASSLSFHDCTWRMEQAMKAMEPFIAMGIWPNDKDDPKEQWRAYFLWRDAKRDCWKENP